jgi:hypothetical protein
MPGLYDTPVGALDPRSMALMQMGLSMMGSSGPSATPVSLGQSFGKAGMQGMQTYQSGIEAQQQEAFRRLQAQKMEEQMKLEREKAARPPALMSGAPGTVIFDPATRQPIFTVPHKPEAQKPATPYSDIGKLNADLQAGLIKPEEYQARIGRMNAPPQPVVTVDNRGENEFNKAVGKEMGQQYSSLMQADFSAPTTIGKYQRLGSLLGQVNTGKFKGTTTELKAAAKSMGFDLNTLGVGDDVAPAQAARALSNQLALELRNPAGGAGMPGALSDKDREFLVQSLPTLESDPGAVGKMIEYRVKLAQREQKVARMAREYRRKNGKFDDGFFDELNEWSEKNPLFANEKPAAPAPSGSGWSIKPKGG